jgi:hypothetical protein
MKNVTTSIYEKIFYGIKKEFLVTANDKINIFVVNHIGRMSITDFHTQTSKKVNINAKIWETLK